MDVTRRKITKIAREVSKFTVRTLRADGVGTGEFDVIHAVRKNPGITQSEVCRITGLDKGAVARQTANLEAKGYLRRCENPADGRSRLLYATEQAEALKNSKTQIESDFYEWLTEPLIGNGHHADVRLDGAERIIGALRARVGDGVEQGGLSDVRQPDDT